MSKTYIVEGIVLNRRDYGEADRIVVIFTQEFGKRAFLAKSVRKLNSKRLASVEIGSHIRAMAVTGKSMDILSQTVIINSFHHIKQDLPSITRLFQLLEVVDSLTRDDQQHLDVYQTLLTTLNQLNLAKTNSKKNILITAFQTITQQLGFAAGETSELALKARIEDVAAKKLHTKEFLMPAKINP